MFEEELVQTEPVHEEIVEKYSPPPVEDFAEVIEEQEQIREEPPPRHIQPQP
ncbi:MAG: hypothetical protein ACTFAK_03850 [Candidatus Electronema sp. VV]